MQHRTKVIRVTDGYAGICSCGYATPTTNESAARIAINDHELAGLRQGVHVTHLDPAQTEIPGTRRPK